MTQSLRTVSMVGGLQLCLRQDWKVSEDTTLSKGLWGQAYQLAGSFSPTREPNFIFTYMWFDGQFVGRPGIEGSGAIALGLVSPGGDFNNPTTFDPSPKTHSLVMISKSLNKGRYPQKWEGRWFRTYNRGFGAWPDSGGVHCEFGEGWQVEEVTDPNEIALMNQYQSTFGNPNYQSLPPYPLFSGLDPRLCPTPWRQNGSCAVGPYTP